MRASIIIRSFNEERHIAKLLSGILEQDFDNYEIVLVDSGSTDATVSIATHYPVTIVSIRPEDFSFGYALNRGCTVANGDILVFASAHVYPVRTDWLSSLLTPFKCKEVGLVYGKQRGNEQTQYSEHQVFARWFPDISDLDQQHPFCNNANAAIRKSLWQSMPYDESLTGLEDLDWGKKLLKMGYKIAYIAEAEIVHVHQETPRQVFNRYRREAMAMKQIISESHFTFADFTKLFFSNVFHDFLHALHEGVFMRQFSNIVTFRLMQHYGTYQGHTESKQINNELRQRFYYPKSFNIKSRRSSHGKFSSKLIDYSHLIKEKEGVKYE